MDMRKFTLTLSDEAAMRIAAINRILGGTIPGYATTLASDFSLLPIEQQIEFKLRIAETITRLQAAGLVAAPKIPAVPPQLIAEAKTLLHQVSTPHPRAHKRPSHRGTHTSKAGAQHAAAEHT
jgi:hypothetical protein